MDEQLEPGRQEVFDGSRIDSERDQETRVEAAGHAQPHRLTLLQEPIAKPGERTNVDLVKAICILLDEARPRNAPHQRLINFVKDRPGHDRRYAINPRKIELELGWKPRESPASGLRKTVGWYLDNDKWVADVTSGAYKRWIDLNYSKR